jgi:predicted DNA-binding transcriptional regulator AlpA
MSSKARLSFPEEDRLLDIDAIAWLFDLTREAVYNRRHRNDFPPPRHQGRQLPSLASGRHPQVA